ncbi:Hypothetical protein J6896_02171 [Nakaseomyces glabratus]|nr:hypothetical protein J7298_02173 [Nakaseomyces glabratus]KAH7600710.1 hypothetical protein J7295_02179 [Nakaseomyces glabratus]KAH7613148.1 hypothetical protein J7292_02155 [Nakaseomyces glabratus]
MMYKVGVRSINSVRQLSRFRRWHELDLAEQHKFIHRFAENYRKRYPGSKTNLSFRGLMKDIDTYKDSPSVFGIFYNSICDNIDHGRDNGRFAHDSFRKLVLHRNDST